MINEHLRRRRDISAPVDMSIRVLDFGCGVGRVMEAVSELGIANVDGQRDDPRRQPEPALAQLALLGDRRPRRQRLPGGYYDLAYSLICMNHISMRQTRIDMMRSLARALKPGGTVVLELLYYPSIHSSQIPLPHVSWSQNRTSVDTNSSADVWVTPDKLGEVIDDMKLAYRDVALQEIDLWDNLAVMNESPCYPVRQNVLLVSGTVGRVLSDRYFGTEAPYPTGEPIDR